MEEEELHLSFSHDLSREVAEARTISRLEGELSGAPSSVYGRYEFGKAHHAVLLLLQGPM
jgi:hypothetical protein